VLVGDRAFVRLVRDTRLGDLDGDHQSVVVVGGGQAGLAMSYCLRTRGIDHLVLESERACHTWQSQRWRTFSLVTPNWQCRLPGMPYGGDDPDGFMVRDEIVEYLSVYRDLVDPPLVEGVSATRLRRDDRGSFEVTTTAGTVTADQLVVATGGYHEPIIPRFAERLPAELTQITAAEYTHPGDLPDGEVLVVGSGQSGAQIAEDLHLAGRTVHLSVGSAPRVARFYRGRDVTAWLDDMGYYDMPVQEHPRQEAVRAQANHYVTGRDGGRDIDLRAFARYGMRLYGRLAGFDGDGGGTLRFAPDLTRNLNHADEVSESIKDTIDKHISRHGIDAPQQERYSPVWTPPEDPVALQLTATAITSVVWCVGFRSDFRWIDLPVFTGSGYPSHERGVTSAPGLYFLGLPWLYTWGSGRFSGVGRDAEYLADRIREHRRVFSPTSYSNSRGDMCNVLALGS
jgi:putative flavoprotein involved in K+ transport